MKKDIYSLEELAKNFANHAVQYEKYRLEWLEKFKIDYPNERVPSHMKESFNISSALEAICLEILKLKNSSCEKKR